MIAEASARHHVEVYGNSGSTQASPEGAFDSRLVDASQTDDRTFATFQIVVNRLVEAFRDATGPSPTFGAPQTQEDQEFLIAYGALRAAYWPDGSVDPYNGGEDNDF